MAVKSVFNEPLRYLKTDRNNDEGRKDVLPNQYLYEKGHRRKYLNTTKTDSKPALVRVKTIKIQCDAPVTQADYPPAQNNLPIDLIMPPSRPDFSDLIPHDLVGM